ncbi:GNAT family N-acetyltransferase [Pseudoroseomonas deserti]|uniref:GNAT family N-acetyltransferase n=1 Tax=Teichococcus deserti TaxID=1817963 RepID=A0A1V2H6W6_9PROT|nr:GNAT family N-acetyltransferase [Pseudoroseomonas deserti]ONG57243.1 GNAT family N-acetyltransferase [Pseudoroseomonas deserti]
MISIRRALPADAPAIAAVHVAAWRSAYAGLLPDLYLAGLSEARLATVYRRGLVERRDGEALFVAIARDTPDGPGQVVGFASGGKARRSGLAEGEIATLYVLDDWRDQGIGRRLLRAAAAHLAAIGCHSAMLWVLTENPARWFYQHLGGRRVAVELTRVGGSAVEQTAMLWDPIALLLAATIRA